MKKNLSVLLTIVMLVMAGCSSKPTLSEFVESDVVVTGEQEANAAFAEAGLGFHLKYSAEGEDILVLSFIYDEYQYLTGLDQSIINDTFAEQLINCGASSPKHVSAMFEEAEEATGITLKCIRMQFVNADGTIIYSQEHINTN